MPRRLSEVFADPITDRASAVILAHNHPSGDIGENSIEARYEQETVWLTQKLISELFNVSIPTINEHLKHIFESGELDPDSVIRKFRITAADGKSYLTKHYNLDAIQGPIYRRVKTQDYPC